jgi:transposase
MRMKPIEILIRKGLRAEDFNDDVLGMALDKLYSHWLETIFMTICANVYNISKFLHLDTTTISVEGEYEHEEDEHPIKITYGYSKQGRPDLKQFVISLIMCGDAPAFIKALSGNTSDKDNFREIAKQYGAQLREKWGENTIWVWDSAGYSKKNIKSISSSYKWIMRVPETLS